MNDALSVFDRQSNRLHEYLLNLCDEKENSVQPGFQKFINIILFLSHGQTSVERGFSYNKDLLVPNLSQRSLIAQHIIRDYMIRNCNDSNDSPINYETSEELLASATLIIVTS